MGSPHYNAKRIEAHYSVGGCHNRTAEKAQPLIAQGAELADNPANVVEPDGIAITMLSNDQALEEVVLGENGILDKLGSGGIHLSMSTVSSATANKLAKHHEQRGAHYLAAPVFGRPDAAAARKLGICLSGNGVAKERVLPLLNILGQGVCDFGEEVGAANVVKIAGNFLIISAIEAMAEAFTLAEKNGGNVLRLLTFSVRRSLDALSIKTMAA